ncbi:MAG: hypothetical protein CMJ78_18115 [Planctomycetaceae bacterium]|nr:hypothetical protein [Planctomycetaceae bacterium]
MDRLNELQSIVTKLIDEFAEDWNPHDGTSIEAVIDQTHGHFQIIRTGWKDDLFVHMCLVHLVIRSGKIELLKNETEILWDQELMDRGVLPGEIVLAFRHSQTPVQQ